MVHAAEAERMKVQSSSAPCFQGRLGEAEGNWSNSMRLCPPCLPACPGTFFCARSPSDSLRALVEHHGAGGAPVWGQWGARWFEGGQRGSGLCE